MVLKAVNFKTSLFYGNRFQLRKQVDPRMKKRKSLEDKSKEGGYKKSMQEEEKKK